MLTRRHRPGEQGGWVSWNPYDYPNRAALLVLRLSARRKLNPWLVQPGTVNERRDPHYTDSE